MIFRISLITYLIAVAAAFVVYVQMLLKIAIAAPLLLILALGVLEWLLLPVRVGDADVRRERAE